MALIAISYGLGRYTYGLFVPEISKTLDSSVAVMGTVASIGHLGYIVATMLCMRLIHVFSPRMLMLAGGVSAGVGLLLIAVAGSAVVLAAGTFTASMSAGWIWTATPDAVRQLQPESQRAKVLGWANGGTSVGVLAAGPIALLLIEWRYAYAAYALLALGITAWAWFKLPPMEPDHQAEQISLHWDWFVNPRSSPLLLMALAAGLVSAIYWTFAVDLIVKAGMESPRVGDLFWFVSGSAGVLGVVVAGMIRRYGIRRVIPVNGIILAVALGLLAAAPGNLAAMLISAACFGVGFITITGLLAIWSTIVFEDRPSAGLGVVLILVAGGQVVGPISAGFIAEQIGLIPIFYGGALLALVSTSLRPRPADEPQLAGQST